VVLKLIIYRRSLFGILPTTHGSLSIFKLELSMMARMAALVGPVTALRGDLLIFLAKSCLAKLYGNTGVLLFFAHENC
jgi:hypothetical protein